MKIVQPIQSFDKIKLLADSRRMEILRLLMDSPATLTHLARTLKQSPAWIRHHILTLESADLWKKSPSILASMSPCSACPSARWTG